MKRILILGGSGFVGRHLCQSLAQADVELTVPTRQDPEKLTSMLAESDKSIRFVKTDVLQETNLPELLRDHDIVINLVAILHGNERTFEQVHANWARSLAEMCARAGVKHLIHVSALGANIDGPSMYQRSKGRGEQYLQRVSSETGLPVTIIRPSVIFGLDDQFINTFASLQRFAPFVPLTGANARFQPVWVEDVAQALTNLALSWPRSARLFEACGPEVFSLSDLVRHAGRWAGCQRPILPLPSPIGKLQALMMEILPGRTLMSRDNVDSLSVDNVASGTLPGLSDLGITPTKLGTVFQVRS